MTYAELEQEESKAKEQMLPVLSTWNAMRDRCYNKNNLNYGNYGGRGIRVSKLWRNDFDAFYAYIGPKPSPKHSLDRINNDHGYVPGNIRWATAKEQANNTRYQRKLTYNGKTQTVVEWSRETGLSSATICFRLYEQKWSVDKTLSTPATHNPYKKNLKEDGQAGYIKYVNKDYNELIILFNTLQRRSIKKLFINRELLKAFRLYVETAKR